MLNFDMLALWSLVLLLEHYRISVIWVYFAVTHISHSIYHYFAIFLSLSTQNTTWYKITQKLKTKSKTTKPMKIHTKHDTKILEKYIKNQLNKLPALSILLLLQQTIISTKTTRIFMKNWCPYGSILQYHILLKVSTALILG